MKRRCVFVSPLALAIGLVACSGNVDTVPLPTPAPSASPAPGILSIAPSNSLSFAGTGASYAQTVTVTDSIATTGLIVAAQNCGTGASAIVVFGSPSGIGTTFQIVVTPLAAGSCSALISDS